MCSLSKTSTYSKLSLYLSIKYSTLASLVGLIKYTLLFPSNKCFFSNSIIFNARVDFPALRIPAINANIIELSWVVLLYVGKVYGLAKFKSLTFTLLTLFIFITIIYLIGIYKKNDL